MNPDQWERFCHALGDPELAGDPRFANNDARVANRDEFRARVEARLATATTEEWVRRLEKATIACGPIYEFDEVFADAQVQHLGLVTEMEQPGYGRIRMLGFPVRGSEIDARVRRPAPGLGEHTAEILGEFRIEGKRLVAQLAHIDGGGEGVLPTLLKFMERYAEQQDLEDIEWIVHALNCSKPNPKLQRVLLRWGYVIEEVEGIGAAYHKIQLLHARHIS